MVILSIKGQQHFSFPQMPLGLAERPQFFDIRIMEKEVPFGLYCFTFLMYNHYGQMTITVCIFR